MKQLVTILNASGANLTMDDVTLHVLNGLPSKYKEISANIRSRESFISFHELHEKLCDHETIVSQESFPMSIPIMTNYTSHHGGSNNHTNHNRQLASQGQAFSNQRQTQLGSIKNNKDGSCVVCQYYDKPGHTVKWSWKLFPWSKSSSMGGSC